MNRKPVVPNGYELEVKQEKCPACGATCIANVGNQKRCSICEKQWPERPVLRGPTRRDVLNGTARYIPGRIILWKFR